MRPNGIRHTLGTTRYPNTLSIQRSRQGPAFNDHEEAIMDIIAPHINNLFSGLLAKEESASPERITAAELARGCRLLSKREAEVTALLCQRLTATEIASRLLISPRTVEAHTAKVYEKLRVRNRWELVRKLL